MNKAIITILINLVTLIAITSCNNSHDKSCKVIHVEPEEPKTISIEEIAQDITFVKLETPEDGIIQMVYKLYTYDNKLFIGDYDQKKVFLFNNEGHFLCTIGRFGRGPSETIELADFIIDKNKNEVIIWDNSLKKRVKYTFSGEFVESEPIEMICRNFTMTPSGKYWLYLGLISNYDLSLVDTNGVEIAQYLPIAENTIYFPATTDLQYFNHNDNGEITLLPNLSEKVYILKENGVSLKYKISFGDNHVPSNYYDNRISKTVNKNRAMEIYRTFFEELPLSNYALKSISFKESEKHIYFEYNYKRRWYDALMNKNDDQATAIKDWTLDSENTLKIGVRFFEFHNNRLKGFINTNYLLDQFQQLNKNDQKRILEKFPQLIPILKSSNSNDNPILVSIKLKNNW